MPPILKKRCKFNPKMASRLGKLFLRAKWELWVIGFLSLLFFICCLAAPWLTFSYYWGNSLTHLMLITTFGLSMFGPKVTWKVWVSITNWVSSGLWCQWHNPLSHSPQIAENTVPATAPRFSKMWKCPQYPKQLYLDTVVALSLA